MPEGALQRRGNDAAERPSIVDLIECKSEDGAVQISNLELRLVAVLCSHSSTASRHDQVVKLFKGEKD